MVGEKARCGSALGRTELNKYITYVSKAQKTEILCLKNIRCIFGRKEAPAGAHLDAPSLDNTDSVYVKHRHTDSVYVIHRNLCLRHRQGVYLQQKISMYYT